MQGDKVFKYFRGQIFRHTPHRFKMSLMISDLKKVYRTTFEARNKWRNILLELDVNRVTISSIGTTWRNHPEDCYREGLSEWLGGGERSWGDIVKALSSPTVGHSDIAAVIEGDFIQSAQGMASVSSQNATETNRHADTEEVDKLCDQLEPCVAEKAELTQTLELGQKDQKVYMTHGLISWDRTKGDYASPYTHQQAISENLTIFTKERLGSGAFGVVFKGSYKSRPCAVKVLHQVAMQIQMNIPAGPEKTRIIQAFDRECEFLKSFRNPNIVQHLSTDEHPMSGSTILVTELMDCSLRSFLSGLGEESLDSHCQLSLIKDVASGLAYIHSRRIIHRDLCGDNVLLRLHQPMPVAKISDFGMSRLLEPSQMSSTLTAVGHRKGYLPPEALRLDNEEYDHSLDVFSLGVIMVQILQKVETVKTAKDRSYLASQIPTTHRLKPIISDCLQEDRRTRPTASNVCAFLEREVMMNLGRELIVEEMIALVSPPESVRGQCDHSFTTTSLGPELNEVFMFVGPLKLRGDPITEPTILRFERSLSVTGPPTEKWAIVDVAHNNTGGSSQRLREKWEKIRQATYPSSSKSERGRALEQQLRAAEQRATNAEQRAAEEFCLRQSSEHLLREAKLRCKDGERQSQQTEQRAVEAERRVQELITENSRLQRELEGKTKELAVHNTEVWRIPSSKVVTMRTIGAGGWGEVLEGTVRVAVKRLHIAILSQRTLERLQREMMFLAEVRHPNLVQFIGAVFDRSPPLIVTELLDINLRQAYEQNRLGPGDRQSIFIDVAKAVDYLHQRYEPIIHRDVSAPNVLLQRMPNNQWKAKVSDLGSANFLQNAQTMGEGAIVYSSPEVIPQPFALDTEPPPQTVKIDVYSYGIVLCEVTASRFPSQENFRAMFQQVQRECPQVYELIVECTKRDPSERPSMAEVIVELSKMRPF